MNVCQIISVNFRINFILCPLSNCILFFISSLIYVCITGVLLIEYCHVCSILVCWYVHTCKYTDDVFMVGVAE